MEYTAFDWSAMPLSEERRLAEDSDQPMKVVTMYLRQTAIIGSEMSFRNYMFYKNNIE